MLPVKETGSPRRALLLAGSAAGKLSPRIGGPIGGGGGGGEGAAIPKEENPWA
jgi:hypothetical protein